MIRIAVVDDDIRICSHIERYMMSFSEKYNHEIEVEPYTSSEAFFKSIQENHEVYDLIFLDIEVDEKTGIDIAEYIRYVMQDELQQIVYISGKSDYSLSLHDTHPLDFIIKPIKEEQLEKVIMRMDHHIFIYNAEILNFIYFYFYRVPSYLVRKYVCPMSGNLHIPQGGEECFRGSIREIEESLRKYNFLYIHRSYLVNPIYIKIYEYDQVILTDNKTKLPIGSSKRAEICKKRMELQRMKKEEE